MWNYTYGSLRSAGVSYFEIVGYRRRASPVISRISILNQVELKWRSLPLRSSTPLAIHVLIHLRQDLQHPMWPFWNRRFQILCITPQKPWFSLMWSSSHAAHTASFNFTRKVASRAKWFRTLSHAELKSTSNRRRYATFNNFFRSSHNANYMPD